MVQTAHTLASITVTIELNEREKEARKVTTQYISKVPDLPVRIGLRHSGKRHSGSDRRDWEKVERTWGRA